MVRGRRPGAVGTRSPAESNAAAALALASERVREVTLSSVEAAPHPSDQRLDAT